MVAGKTATPGKTARAGLIRVGTMVFLLALGTGPSDTEAAGMAVEQHFRGKGRRSAGFDLSPKTLELIKTGMTWVGS